MTAVKKDRDLDYLSFMFCSYLCGFRWKRCEYIQIGWEQFS